MTSDHLHRAAALLHLFLLPLSTAGSALSFLLLLGVAAARLRTTAHLYPPLLRQPLLVPLAAFVVWAALSLAWTSDLGDGLADLRALRMALLPLLLWPLANRAPWLVGAALCGVAAQNGAQLLQLLGWLDLRPWDAASGRLGGFVHPIQTGAWCVAALCWHVSALARGRRRVRLISAVAGAAALLGLLGSQSRGPWLAAAVTLPVELVALGLYHARSRRALLVTCALALVATLVAWPMVSRVVERRVRDAVAQYDAARERGVCTSDVGLRVCQWRWSWEMIREAPLRGVGLGGFADAQKRLPSYAATLAAAPAHEGYLDRKHPHNAPLHILATGGVVGMLLAAGVGALALQAAWRARDRHLYAVGTLFVLLAWGIGALFDSYNLSGRLLGLFMLAVTIALSPAPESAGAAPERAR